MERRYIEGLAQAGDLPEKPVLVNLHNQHPASQEALEFEVFPPATCSFYFVVISMFGIKLVVTLSNMLRFDTLQFDVMMNAYLEISSWLS